MSVSVKLGALVSFNSTIDAFVQQAIQLAVHDVNNAEDVLHGSELVLEMFDSGQDPVQAASCGNFFPIISPCLSVVHIRLLWKKP
jgi:ABC-type branched-subunit amino acid transport system substrate-binding protein